MVKDKFTIQNVVMSVLTALVLFMGRWVFDTNTYVALLDQRIATEEKTRLESDQRLQNLLTENKTNYNKMAETMAKLDKTLTLLSDRLDRGGIISLERPQHELK